jgi:hypothetical protein
LSAKKVPDSVGLSEIRNSDGKSQVKASLGIAPSAFVFLPGNHDVSWQACQDYFKANPDKRVLLYDPLVAQTKLRHFNDFRVNFYGKENRPEIIPLERGASLYTFDSKGLCIVALNSCEQETDQRYGGVVSEEQARKVMDIIRQDYQNYIKIVALHHPINSTADKAAPWKNFLEQKCQAGEMTKALFQSFCNDALSVEGNEFVNAIVEDCRVHLVLHGHQHSYDMPHQHRWRDPDGYCQICPAGSLGLDLKPEKMLKDQPNCLRLHHLFEKNARLQLNSISIEYDPLERLEGVVTKGCFRNTGREPFEASFPLALQFAHWAGSVSRKEVPAATAGIDQHDYIHKKIVQIFNEKIGFRDALADRLKKTDTPEGLARALVEKGLEKAWREIIRDLNPFKDHFDELKRVLFLLAQATIKAEEITSVRTQMKTEDEYNVFILNSRYALMAELILKAAIETEISVIQATKDGRLSVEPRNFITVKLDSGIDRTKSESNIAHDLALRSHYDATKWSEDERVEWLRGVLEAYFNSNMPFLLVHSCRDPLKLRYLPEFILPSHDKRVPPDGVTSINEHTLYELIKIILTTIDSHQRGAP